jgi:hypothetical protein
MLIIRDQISFINDNAEWLQMDKIGHFIPPTT